ncbi:hypothetical protein Pcinc_025581 [Petrolisthes cinctipes]|uniref:Uncharacterized protein n=1 Tax=Petrolisthes cinctipes TaxID=88211 RepID=A0AAE1KBD9_PETCI|nr:hypothetical protein Pcinc_025581 [Petrolisthes cinctipes]
MHPSGSTPGSSTSGEGAAAGTTNTTTPPSATSTSDNTNSEVPSAPPVLEGTTDCHISLPPPPSYETVLDLKRRDMAVQQNQEEREVEVGVTTPNMRDKIRTLLGRVRAGRTSTDPPPSPNLAYGAETSRESSMSSGLFTISGESVSSPSYHQLPPPHIPPTIDNLVPPSTNSETSSHSDYSSSFLSSPSSGSRSFQPSPSQTPTESTEPQPSTSDDLSLPEPVGASRPCTGRSILSRPTTSISTRTLPPPPQLTHSNITYYIPLPQLHSPPAPTNQPTLSISHNPPSPTNQLNDPFHPTQSPCPNQPTPSIPHNPRSQPTNQPTNSFHPTQSPCPNQPTNQPTPSIPFNFIVVSLLPPMTQESPLLHDP